MGHRLSKSVSSVVTHHQQQQQQHQQQQQQQRLKTSQNNYTRQNEESLRELPHTNNCGDNSQGLIGISSNQQKNLKENHLSTSVSLPSTSTDFSNQNLWIESATLTVPAQVAIAPSRFIIKIQLTKMEPGNANCDTTTLSTTVAVDNNSGVICDVDDGNTTTVVTAVDNLDNNLNIKKPILNLTLTKNIPCDVSSTGGLDQQHQIIIDSDNETVHLNNLNATATNATTATNNSNFVNNFISVSSAPSNLTQPNKEYNNLTQRLSNLNLISSENSSNNNFNKNHNNGNISNLNCLNNNNDNNNVNSPSNSICNQEYQDCPDINQRISGTKQTTFNATMCGANSEDDKSHCCRKKKSSAYPSKWRCCKCNCHDSAKLANVATTAECSSSKKQEPVKCSSSKSSWTSKFNCTKKDNTESKQQNLTPVTPVTSPSPSSSSSNTFSDSSSSTAQLLPLNIPNFPGSQSNCSISNGNKLFSSSENAANASKSLLVSSQSNRTSTCPRSDHLTMWEPILPLTPFIDHHHHHHHHHHIQPIARCPGGPHNLFVFSVNHPSQQPSQFVIGQIEEVDERSRRLRAAETETGVDPLPSEIESALANVLLPQNTWHHIMCSPSNFGIVHSQVDYIHCLVPDLEKITSSSFYWGKMDRYEAEKLLEGKPEGTFLLRDSAQEEYLFSVTFRKYERSLHARIEQFNHKFSFDCHDPGVYTASTVTGLLEHYKDPSCVMFFEPMLTIPLHRNFTFSLQQLCRATIVSHVSYDSINELQLPNVLKSYLKEYHYKLRVRVKPFDEPFYTCS